jgi:hypothetical protein
MVDDQRRGFRFVNQERPPIFRIKNTRERTSVMNTSTDIKDVVRSAYAGIAGQSKEQNAASCCGVGGCSTVDYTIFAEDYSTMKGYVANADLGLGCGVPTEFAQIREGDFVVDL